MDDLISRKLAIELLENTIAMTKKEERRRNYCVELIKTMPSAYPKKGKWRFVNCANGLRCQCSECLHWVDAGTDRNYCPNCGADMRESE